MSRQPKLAEPGGPPLALWAGLILLLAATFLLWAPGQKGFFALDDFIFLEAYAPGAPRSSPAEWLTSVSPVDNAYRPLTTAAYFSLAREAFGLDAQAYHLASLALHCLTTLLVAGLCWTLVRNSAAALLGGLFYATRSCLWVAVRWTSGVQELGLALGADLAALGLAYYVRRGRLLGLAACFTGVFIALGSKEASLSLVVALIPLAPAASPKGWGRRAARALIPAAALTGLYLLWRVVLTWSHPTIHKTTTAPAHLAQRLAKFLLWSFTSAPSSSVWGAVALGLAGIGLFALSRHGARSTPRGQPPPAWARSLSAGIAFYGISLIPPLVITQVAHQYYLAMPLVGLSLAVAGASGGLIEALEPRSRLLAAVLVLSLTGAPLAAAKWEVGGKDAGRLASGGFYKPGDGAIYEKAWRGISGLWPKLPEGATLLIADYPYDGLISSDVRGKGLRPTSTMASMFRTFYGRDDLTVAHLVAEPKEEGTTGPSEALELIKAEPTKTFVARFRHDGFEALSAGDAQSLMTKLSSGKPTRKAGDR